MAKRLTLVLPLCVEATLHLLGLPLAQHAHPLLSDRGDHASQSTSACTSLRQAFPALVSLPGSSIYAGLTFYAGEERDLAPSCVFTPTSANDVATFLSWIEHDAPGAPSFAVRSGGHMLFAGAANIQNGITVNMAQLNSVQLGQDARTVTLGAGTIFADAYPLLDQHNVTVAGGRIPGIAAGGFTSGGGKPFSGRRFGWSCDSVIAFEIALAGGHIVRATADQHRDLWLALRGGSNNFGIITSFEMATFPQAAMWGGVLTLNYTAVNLEAAAKAFASFMDPLNFDDGADVGFLMGFIGGTFTLQTSLFHLDATNSATPHSLIEFMSAHHTATTITTGTVAEIVESYGKDLPDQVSRIYELVYSFHNPDKETYLRLIDAFESNIRAISTTPGLIVQYMLQPQPVSNGTNAMRLPTQKKDMVMALMTFAWDNEADDQSMKLAVQNLVRQQKSVLSEQNVLVDFLYLNYADGSQDVFDSWGIGAKRALQAVSQKYDPKQVFQKQVPGGFKLW